MTRAERRWLLAYAAIVMVLTSVPYALAYARAGGDWVFTGFVFGVNDGNSYIAKMAEGARGAWLFTFTYTSELQRGAFVFPFFLLLGKLAAPDAGLHEQLVAIFHLARIASGMALLAVIYRFLAEFLPDVAARRYGLILASLGGGLGWVLVLLGQHDWLGSLPLEFYSPEAFTFLDLYGLPHLSAARACLLLGLLAYLRRLDPIDDPGPRQWNSLISWNGVRPGVLLLIAGLIQPLVLVVAFPVLLAHLAVTAALGFRSRDMGRVRRTAGLAALTLGIASPIALYTAIAFRLDPLLARWTAQNTILSPHPVHYLVAYGLLLAPAAIGLQWLWRDRGQKAAAHLFLAWGLVLPFLLYAPFNLQRRLSEAFFIPLVTLAVAGLANGLGEWSRRWGRAAATGLCALSLPSALLLLVGGIGVAQRPAEPAFIPRAEAEAFGFLNREGRPGGVALSSFETGNALPAFTPLVAYLGHGPETLFYEAKDRGVRAFFQPGPADEARQRMLDEGRIQYVIHGPREAALGSYDPDRAPFLSRVYSADGYSVYEYEPAE